MLSGAKVLVVDDSVVFREVLELVLSPHCGAVLSARTLQEGVSQIEQHPDLALVLCEVQLSDGDGFALLEHLRGKPDAAARVILLATRATDLDAKRATDLGAIGYLAKPTTFGEISRILRQAQGDWNAGRAPRRRSLARAHLKDPRLGDAPHLAWEVRDVSATGAFLETKGPIEVGTELDLCLVFGAAMAHVKALVVRVQEPSWSHEGGVGVRFTKFYESSLELLENYVSLSDEVY